MKTTNSSPGLLVKTYTCHRKKYNPEAEKVMEMVSWTRFSSWYPVSRPLNHCITASGGVKRSKSYQSDIVSPVVKNTTTSTKNNRPDRSKR